MKSEYKKRYLEIELIGKGTSGSATLVKNIAENKFFISKKIKLQGNEKAKASQEVFYNQIINYFF